MARKNCWAGTLLKVRLKRSSGGCTAFGTSIDPTRIHLEEFLVSDKEVSVEVYCTPHGPEVAAVTEKFLSPQPYFAETGHRVPYPGADADKLAETARRACIALGIDRGVAHVEIKILSDGYYVIEVGARPAGDKIDPQAGSTAWCLV